LPAICSTGNGSRALVLSSHSAILSVCVPILDLSGLLVAKDMLSHSQITLIILWLLYFAMHSLLASNTVKRRVSDLMPGVVPYYRLLYNLLATILLLPVLYLMYRYPGDVL
jgi:hypothetical protein